MGIEELFLKMKLQIWPFLPKTKKTHYEQQLGKYNLRNYKSSYEACNFKETNHFFQWFPL